MTEPAPRDDRTVLHPPTVQSGGWRPPPGVANPRSRSQTWLLIGGPILAVVIVVVLVVAILGHRGSDSPVAIPLTSPTSPLTSPTAPSTVTSASPVTATAAPVPVRPTDPASGTWSGTMTSRSGNVYFTQVQISVAPGGPITGTVTCTSEETHNRGTYAVTGYQEGIRVVLNGQRWVSRPNSRWFMDHLNVMYDGSSTMSGRFGPVDAPSAFTGTVELRRS